ncbi:hypothetical protein [Rhodococcus aetherivorans]|uniref:hypothetical protein n=1 Tax=Rhodococcus aetherivorans TaxID=191292 RepID=UPI001260AA63|nr:hypothetical protein [Rhodococcus aetherivorans]
MGGYDPGEERIRLRVVDIGAIAARTVGQGRVEMEYPSSGLSPGVKVMPKTVRFGAVAYSVRAMVPPPLPRITVPKGWITGAGDAAAVGASITEGAARATAAATTAVLLEINVECPVLNE